MKFGINEIMKMIPHRAPFLLLDKVIECTPGQLAVGIKNVTIDEPFFQGHFLGNPIVPGVLLVEVMTQVTAIMFGSVFYENVAGNKELASMSEAERAQMIAEHIGYLVEIKSMKFMKPVVPGDSMRVEIRKKGGLATLSLVEGKIYVDGELVVEGKLSVSEKV